MYANSANEKVRSPVPLTGAQSKRSCARIMVPIHGSIRMTLHWKGIAFATAFVPLLWPLSARADWAQSADPLVVQTRPSNSEVQLQNPPTFSWARYPGGAARYEIQIRPEGGSPLG